MPVPSADKLLSLAVGLRARLPGTGALLAAGKLSYAEARAVDEAFELLSREDAAAAEAMILPRLPGRTYGQVERLAAAAAVTVDPGLAARRRQDAERRRSRVTVFRERSGAAGLSGRDLPTGQTLAAHATVCARAQEYKDSGAFAGTRMDQFRAAAYLDLLNQVSAADRIASGRLVAEKPDAAPRRGPAGRWWPCASSRCPPPTATTATSRTHTSPGGKLRHLVQIRDRECTFPPCSRNARESDFEHATPYHKGGKTCCCNAGARSRQCHQVKQSPGWNVTQPQPGWHRWETPPGRVYTQEPYRYPV